MTPAVSRPLHYREGTIVLALILAVIAPTALMFLIALLGPPPFLLDRDQMGQYVDKARIRQEATVELNMMGSHREARKAAETFVRGKARRHYVKTMDEHRYTREDNGHHELVIAIDNGLLRVEGRDRTHVDQVFGDLPFVIANPQQNLVWRLLTHHLLWFLLGMAAYVLLLTALFSRWHSSANTVPGEDSVIPAPLETLRESLLQLSDSQLPFEIHEQDQGRLRANWKIADIQWREILYRGGLKSSHSVLMAFDEKQHTVRAIQGTRRIQYGKGLLGAVWSFAGSRSVGFGYESAARFGFLQTDEGLRPAQAYAYRYIPAEITQPVAQLVIQNGWRFKPVYTFFRLVGG